MGSRRRTQPARLARPSHANFDWLASCVPGGMPGWLPGPDERRVVSPVGTCRLALGVGDSRVFAGFGILVSGDELFVKFLTGA